MSNLKPIAKKIIASGERLLPSEVRNLTVLFQALTSDNVLLKSFDRAFNSKDVDDLVNSFLYLTVPIQATAHVVNEILQYEANKWQLEPPKLVTEIADSDTFTASFVRSYAHIGSRKYLRSIVGPTIEKIMASSTDFTQDSAALSQTMVELFAAITKQEAIQQIPLNVLQIIQQFKIACRTQDVDPAVFETFAALYLAKQVFGVVIAKPKKFKMINDKPQGVQLANLTIIANKLLPMIALGKTYPDDGQYKALNPIITRHAAQWKVYARTIFVKATGRMPPEIKAPNASAAQDTIVAEEAASALQPQVNDHSWYEDDSDENAVKLPINLPRFDLIGEMPFIKSDISLFQHALFEYAPEIVDFIQFEIRFNLMRNRSGDDVTRHTFHFIHMLDNIYHAEVLGNNKERIKGPTSANPDKPHVSMRDFEKFKTFADIETYLKQRMITNIVAGSIGPKEEAISIKLDLSDIIDARFFYVGKPAKTNAMVIYFIASRLRHEFVRQLDKILGLLHLVLTEVISNYYQVLIDLSFADLNDEEVGHLFRAFVSYLSFASPDMYKYCLAIYVLHPTFRVQQQFDEFLSLMSIESKARLIRYVHQWTDLLQIIDLERLWIPFLTKRFTPVAYHVIQDKEQKRKEVLVKITNDSLLEIDYRTCRVENEILLKNIEEIRTKVDDGAALYEAFIQYRVETDEEIAKRKATYFFNEKHSSKGMIKTMHLLCFTEAQMQNIVVEVFEAGVRALGAATNTASSSFLVDKRKKNLSYDKRMLKLTYDSILHFKSQAIRSEIPYSTIASLVIDEENEEQLFIFYNKKERIKRVVVKSQDVQLLKTAIQDALERFKFVINVERDINYSRSYDFVLERFFSASIMKAEQDKVFKSIIRTDTPFQNLIKLFNKSKPVNGKIVYDYHNVLSLIEGCKYMGLDMKPDEVYHVAMFLDRKEKGYLELEDFVRGLYYVYRAKALVDRRNKQLLLVAQENKS